MVPSLADQGTVIMDRLLLTDIPRLHMVMPLRSMGVLITDRVTPAIGIMVLTLGGVIMDTGGRSGQKGAQLRYRQENNIYFTYCI